MTLRKYAFELLANFFAFGWACWFIFMVARTLDGDILWIEPNPYILGFEMAMSCLIVIVGAERWWDDFRNPQNTGFMAFSEIALDTMVVAGGALMLGNFIAFTQGGVMWHSMSSVLLYTNMALGILVAAVALVHLLADAERY